MVIIRTLKQVQESDIDLFFNTDELAEDAIINGISCIIISKPEALKIMKLKMGEGVRKAEVMFEVKKTDLPGKPKVDGRLIFNGVTYTVIACNDNGLTYEIVLEAYQ